MRYRKLAKMIVPAFLLIGVWIGTICYVQRTRIIEGTWVDLFEQSSFFENQSIAEACGKDFDEAPWFAYYPSEDTAEGKMVSANRKSGQFISEYGPHPVAAYSVRFIGRRNVSQLLGVGTLLGFGYGHLGGAGSEFQIDRMMSIHVIPNVRCDVR